VSTSNEALPFSNAEQSGSTGSEATQVGSARKVDPDNPVWGIPTAFAIWLASLVLQVIVPVFFLVPFIIHRGLSFTSPDFAREAAELALTDPTAILLQVISVLPIHLLTLALIWAVVTRFGKRPFFASFGWEWSPQWQILEVLGLIALGGLLFLLSALILKITGADQPTQLEQIINSSLAARYTIAVLAVFTAPFVEEFTYRGLIYSALQRTIGVRAAVVIVFLLFTLIHVPQYRQSIGVIIAVGVLSLVLSVVRAYSGRLLPCVIIHMAFNTIQAALLIIEPMLRRAMPTEPVPTVSFLLPFIHRIF